MSSSKDDSRAKMHEYWTEHSTKASLVEMMLDENADKISQFDMDEIATMVPSLKGKRILELGAGIGRYTGWLAEQAENVVAVDFIDKFIKRNEEINGSKGNIEFVCADATKLAFPPNSFDIVFSNWLLMYLTDEETFKLLQNVLSWLTDDGFLFFRESCNKPSGSKKRGENPTIYRKLGDYDDILNSVTMPMPGDGNSVLGFELLLVRSNQAYVNIKKNPFQLCWLAQKSKVSVSDKHGCRSLHEFLDKKHYSKKDIAKFDLLLGHLAEESGTSSADETASVSSSNGPLFSRDGRLMACTAKHLNLKNDEEVLEVGCGAGWGAFYLAEEFGVRVYAIDLSANMIEKALQLFDDRYKHHNILFEMTDALQRDFTEARFNAIYCCDTLLHIENKTNLFVNFCKWLKPGGRVVIAELCIGNKDVKNEELKKYIQERHFYLNTADEINEVCLFSYTISFLCIAISADVKIIRIYLR